MVPNKQHSPNGLLSCNIEPGLISSAIGTGNCLSPVGNVPPTIVDLVISLPLQDCWVLWNKLKAIPLVSSFWSTLTRLSLKFKEHLAWLVAEFPHQAVDNDYSPHLRRGSSLENYGLWDKIL